MGIGIMICWMDHEPVTRSLESAAIRTLRPCANNETGKKESILKLKEAAPPPSVRRKMPAKTPQRILVTYNKTKTRERRVHPEDNPRSWVWYSDFKSWCIFEQKRSRPYQGSFFFVGEESQPFLVLWVCLRNSKVDWPTLCFKARSRRPLLKCAELLPFVLSPSRRAQGSAKVSKELERPGLPGVRPVTVEVNISETVAFGRAAWRRRCLVETAGPFPGCEGTKV